MSQASPETALSSLTAVQRETVTMLSAMGFDEAGCISAAQIFEGNVMEAANWLSEYSAQQDIMDNDHSPSLTQPQPQQQPREQPTVTSVQSLSNKPIGKSQRTSQRSSQSSRHQSYQSSQQKQSQKQSQQYSPSQYSHVYRALSVAQNKQRYVSMDDIAIAEICDQIGSDLSILEVVDSMEDETDQRQKRRDSDDERHKMRHIVDDDLPVDEEKVAEFNANVKRQSQLAVPQNEILSEYLVHKAAWLGDTISLKNFPPELLNIKDLHGNTPLSIAIRLGMPDVAHELLAMGADPRIELGCGWNILQETCLHQDQRLVTDLIIHTIQLRGNEYETKKDDLLKRLRRIGDFKLEIKWQVGSSVPGVNKFLQKFSDIENFKIWKKGGNIRFDSFIRGFSATGVRKGHLSFIFAEGNIVSIDHDRHTFENAIRKYKNPDFDELSKYIRLLLTTEQGRAMMTTSAAKYTTKKDWLGRPKTEKIDQFDCDVYGVSGLCLSVIGPSDKKEWKPPDFDYYFGSPPSYDPSVAATNNKSKKRGLKKAIKSKFSNNNASNNDTQPSQPHSMNANNSATASAKPSLKAAKGVHPTNIIRRDNPVNVTVWQSKEFPLQEDDIAVILEAIAIASEDMRRLSDVFQLEFQNGFPIKLDIPVVVGVSAGVTFCNFEWSQCDDELFVTPKRYRMV